MPFDGSDILRAMSGHCRLHCPASSDSVRSNLAHWWHTNWHTGGARMAKLTNIGIKKATPGRMGDGGGLELERTEVGGKWIYRYSFAGKRRRMGLGTYPTVSLADARRERDRWANVLATGRDPISERRAGIDAARADLERDDPTLEDLAQMVLEAKKAGLRGEGKAGRWMSPLDRHVFAKIGRRPVSTIKSADIRDTLRPIWKTKHPTAEKAIQRLHIILRQGKLMGYECDPFTVEAARHMLGEVMHKPKPIAATPWQDIPDLYQKLDGQGPVAACLQMMILTLVRSAGCRGAEFGEFEGDLWTVPAVRMKGNEGRVSDFRAPLSGEALRILENQRAFGGAFVFSAQRGGPITDTALTARLKAMGEAGRPHGFRTSFRTWVQDTDACAWEVAETVMAHSIGGRVERSYARSDLLDRRRVVMDAWARFVTGAGAADVLTLRR